MDIKVIETKMYRDLRRRLTDEFGGSADITLFYMLRHVRESAFAVCVVTFGKVLFGRGRTENEIITRLRQNLEEYYKGSTEKVYQKKDL